MTLDRYRDVCRSLIRARLCSWMLTCINEGLGELVYAGILGMSLHMLPIFSLFVREAPGLPKGPARCWRQKCPAVSRLRWGLAPPGPDTTPKHTSSSSPFPVEGAHRQRVISLDRDVQDFNI